MSESRTLEDVTWIIKADDRDSCDELAIMFTSGDSFTAVVWPHTDSELKLPVGGRIIAWLDAYKGEDSFVIAGLLVGCGPIKKTNDGWRLFPLSLGSQDPGIPIPDNADILIVKEPDINEYGLAAALRQYMPSRLNLAP